MRAVNVGGLILIVAALPTADILAQAPAGRLEIEATVAFTEGPVWHPSGNVYFTDIANNRILRRDRLGELHVFRTPAGRANGLVFDLEGRLIACEGAREGGNRRVTRTELDGTITVLAERFEQRRFNSPNDVTIDSKGRIYFTDPRYGGGDDLELIDPQGRIIEGVYRIDEPRKVSRILADEVARPNGIAISPDDRYLFVADNLNDGPDQGVGGARKLWRFDLRPDGSVAPESRKLLFDWGTDRGPDGMAINVRGHLFVAAGFNFPNPPAETANKYKAGIYVLSSEGEFLGFIAVPEDMITNCAFGGDDLQTLYVTAGHRLWSVRVPIPGHVKWPRTPARNGG